MLRYRRLTHRWTPLRRVWPDGPSALRCARRESHSATGADSSIPALSVVRSPMNYKSSPTRTLSKCGKASSPRGHTAWRSQRCGSTSATTQESRSTPDQMRTDILRFHPWKRSRRRATSSRPPPRRDLRDPRRGGPTSRSAIPSCNLARYPAVIGDAAFRRLWTHRVEHGRARLRGRRYRPDRARPRAAPNRPRGNGVNPRSAASPAVDAPLAVTDGVAPS